MKKSLFTWDNVKFVIIELIKTFSGKPSFFSSKKIERGIIFIHANILLDVMTNYLMKKNLLDWMGAVAIYAAQMAYAGYQTKQIFKDLKNEREVNVESKE